MFCTLPPEGPGQRHPQEPAAATGWYSRGSSGRAARDPGHCAQRGYAAKRARVAGPLQGIGCSATLNPLEDIAAFLVGCEEDGRSRPCTIVNAGMRKDPDVQVMAPLRDFLEASNTALWSSAYELLLEEISGHTTTLIFTNSRYKAECTALRLDELPNRSARIRAHHGSMSRETGFEAEDEPKAGKLDALVATAALELGIDIGSVDLVYQLDSPKSVSTGLQRIGRAGHLLDATSKGRVLIFERDELLEAAAICRAMTAGQVDALGIPHGCLDVLAQQITGAVAARDWQADELLALIRRPCAYTGLSQDQFDAVLEMLSGDHPFQMARGPRAQVLWDRASGRLSATRSTKHVSSMNIGTIPETAEYEVAIASSNKRIGTVQSEFVDNCLRHRDVFVIGSSSWRVVGVRRNRLLLEGAPGAMPTVPWWLGPVGSRTVEAGRRVGILRREMAARLDDPHLCECLQDEYYLCPDGATATADHVRQQRAAAGVIPDHETLLVETWGPCPPRSRLWEKWWMATWRKCYFCWFGRAASRPYGYPTASRIRCGWWRPICGASTMMRLGLGAAVRDYRSCCHGLRMVSSPASILPVPLS